MLMVQDINPTTPASSEAFSTTHILFIGVPQFADIAVNDILTVSLDIEDERILNTAVHNIVTPKAVQELKERLGRSFISKRNNKLVIHQGVMTVLFAGQDPHVTTEFRTSNWLAEQLEGNRLADYIYNVHDKKLVVYVSCTVSSWNPLSMEEFYYQMRVMKAIHGNMRVYPRESEALWDELKIGDVRAFDEIAASGINFIYRPKTCFGVGECSLRLPEGEHVVKKSYSCSGSDVKVLQAPARHKLSCRIPRPDEIPNTEQPKSRHRRSAKKKHEKTGYPKDLWFHQEYVSSFGVLGEFRVFLCQGKVINSALTRFSAGFRPEDGLSSRVFAAKAVDENAFWWCSDVREQQRKKWEELYTFAEFVYDALSRRHDAQEHYESLEVGLRLDIGVSELTSNGVFFVNEATRFHCADYMSDIISMPSYRTSEVLGKAIAGVCKSGRWQ